MKTNFYLAPLLAVLGACTFDRPADVKFGDSAITITDGDHQTGVVATDLPQKEEEEESGSLLSFLADLLGE